MNSFLKCLPQLTVFAGLIPALFLSVSACVQAEESGTESWAKPALVQEVLDGKRTEACASWWGFDPEDSTRFLQAAIQSEVPVLRIDRQSSDWNVTPLKCVSNQEIVLEDGVVLMAKKGEFRSKGATLLTVSQCRNVTIRGEKSGSTATLRMRKSDYQTEAYEPAEWRHGLSILSSENVQVRDLTIEFTGGDGIYLGVSRQGVTNADVTIQRVRCYENHRQGISVISARNLLIEDCVLSCTNGTAPQAGIDFEPNLENEELTNCVMRRCVCEGNAGDGYEFYLPNLTSNSNPVSILLEDCVSRKNARNGITWILAQSKDGRKAQPVSGTMTVRNFQTIEENQHGIYLRSNPVDSVRVRFEGLLVRSCGQAKPELAPIYFQAGMDSPQAFGDVTFSETTIEDEVPDRPFIRFQDSSIYAWGLERLAGTLACKRNGKTENICLNAEWIQKNYPVKNTHRLPILTLEPKNLTLLKDVPQKTEPEDYSLPFMRFRHSIRFLFYVNSTENLRFSLKLCKVGRPGSDPLALTLTSPDGKVIPLEKLILNEVGNYEVPVSETGIYVLESGSTSHSFQLQSSSVPVAFDAARTNFISATGDVYFYVPKGTKDFGICVTGSDQELVHASVFAPSGAKCWEKDEIGGAEFFYPTPEEAQAGGIWKIHFERPTQGAFEDFSLFLQNVTPTAALRPDFLMQEKASHQ